MKQQQLSGGDQVSSNQEIKIDLEAGKVERPTTKVVRMWYKACCGCGCANVKVDRTVAFDDNQFKDGDEITSLWDDDKFID